MIVRCGRCRAELEIAAPGEFLCPACGTRNAVRGAAPPPPASPFGDAGGLTVPGGTLPPPPPSQPSQPDPNVTWSVCPACSWKFVHGEAETLTCPSCRAALTVTPDGLKADAQT